jgi:nitrogen regulatory protein P-II 1
MHTEQWSLLFPCSVFVWQYCIILANWRLQNQIAKEAPVKKLEIITRPDSLEKLKVLLNEHSIGGITVTSVMGCGIQKGDVTGEFKGLRVSGLNLLPKIMAIIVVSDSEADEILNLLQEQLSTGKVGDGKVFISDVADAMRIRTGDRGSKALH